MKLEFYFDPSCPFCWVTSRWLLSVANKRDLDIVWRPFSLALKNGELETGNDGRTDHLAAHRVIRVMLAAAKDGVPLLDLYTKFGIRHFMVGDEYDDAVITDVLKELKLDLKYANSADDTKFDSTLKTAIHEATKIVGQDIGVPTIVFDFGGGKKTGFFGPVLQALPSEEESIKLWDGLIKLAGSPDFYELKRGRQSGGPDVFSTARC